jgi:hypothetical protein
MTFEFRPAVRENVGLLIGLSGASGAGKTYTAMELAAGIAGEARFAVIDTENRRSRHYADAFKFDDCQIAAPFRPSVYADAIIDADRAGYPVIVVDSMSHEHAGDGGLLDWQEEELTRMAGDEWKKREACKMASWIKPKAGHKAMMNKLLQVRAHVILCFRAEEKVEMVKQEGKWVMVPKKTRTSRDGWIPVCEKSLPYELTCSFLLTPDRPGFPLPIKLQDQHKALFPLDRPIGKETGRALAAWAKGGTAPAPKTASMDDLKQEGREAADGGLAPLQAWFRRLTRDQQSVLKPYLDDTLKPIALDVDAPMQESA